MTRLRLLLALLLALPTVALADPYGFHRGYTVEDQAAADFGIANYGDKTTALKPGQSAYMLMLGHAVVSVTDVDRSGQNGCPADETCVTAAGHDLQVGDILQWGGSGSGFIDEVGGWITEVISVQGSSTFRVGGDTSENSDYTTGGTLTVQRHGALDVSACARYGVILFPNIADPTDNDAIAYPWRCHEWKLASGVNLIPPDPYGMQCQPISFGGFTSLTGSRLVYFDDVPPPVLGITLSIPAGQKTVVEVDCR